MISLFVRSYNKDFEWLSYSIKSMHKNLYNISEKVLAIPIGTETPSDIITFFDKIVYIEETHEGYIQQQIDKVRAYQYCSNDYILFSDSDCIYFKPFNAKCRLTEHHRIILPKTRYELVESAIIWKDITHATTNIMPEYEYMRCFPIMHHATVLDYLDNDQHYIAYLNLVSNRELSEFNALGIIAETYFSNLYKFIDTETVETPIPDAKQYWSWGGITEDIQKELEQI